MRPHRRRAPLVHALVAGDLAQLDSIVALLDRLPEDTYGQVYIEAAEADVLPTISSPPRVTVNKVVRESHHQVGEQLTSAVASWRAEWMPEHSDPDRTVSIWTGTSLVGDLPILSTRLEAL